MESGDDSCSHLLLWFRSIRTGQLYRNQIWHLAKIIATCEKSCLQKISTTVQKNKKMEATIENENEKRPLLSLRVPSLQVELADEPEGFDESPPERSESERETQFLTPSLCLGFGSGSFLKPPPTYHTLPKRGLIIVSPNSPRRYPLAGIFKAFFLRAFCLFCTAHNSHEMIREQLIFGDRW